MLLFWDIFYYLFYINFTVYFDFIVYYLLNIFAIIEHEMCKHQNGVYKMLFLNVYTKILYKMFSSYSCFPCCYMKSENVWKNVYFNFSRSSPRINLVISKLKGISFWKYRKICFLLLDKVQVFCTLRISSSLVCTFYQTVKITVLTIKKCCLVLLSKTKI